MITNAKWRIRCEERHIPIMSTQTQWTIEYILMQQKPKQCAEIGSAVWYSSSIIASIIQWRQGQISSFEIAHNAYAQALYYTKWVPNLTIYPFDVTRIDGEKLMPRYYDFVFIDGQKNQYDQYLMKIEPFLHRESVIVCDDVIKFQNKLQWLYRYVSKMQLFYEIIQTEADDGIMIIGPKAKIKELSKGLTDNKNGKIMQSLLTRRGDHEVVGGL